MIDKQPKLPRPQSMDPSSVARVRMQSTKEVLRLCWRFLIIAGLVIGYALRLAVHLAFRYRSTGCSDQVTGKILCRCLEALGPTFIKLGQILSARPDLISPEWAQALSRLQTRVHPINPRLMLRALRDAYLQPVEAIFVEFDIEPIGSGSIAQVHRAWLKEGAEVAVKIRRPGIQNKIDADLKLLALFARFAASVRALRFMPIVQVVTEVSNLIRQQLDFLREAECNRRFQHEFRNVELVRFPALFDALCTPTVLVMEFMHDLRPTTATGLTTDMKRRAALRGLRVLYQMIFSNGLVHADMHPGNVFVRHWGEVVILDMGLVAQLSDRTRRNFVEFFFAFVNRNGERCAEILCESALFIARDCDRRGFQTAIVQMIGGYTGLRSSEFEITRFVAALMETQRRFGICSSAEFVTSILALVLFDGICKQLYPECDFQAEARPFLIAAKYHRSSSAP